MNRAIHRFHTVAYGVRAVKSRGACTYSLLFRHTFILIIIIAERASKQASARVNEEAIDQIMNAKRFNNIILIHSIWWLARSGNIRMGWLAKAAPNSGSSERRTKWRSQDTFICFMEFLNFIHCESTKWPRHEFIYRLLITTRHSRYLFDILISKLFFSLQIFARTSNSRGNFYLFIFSGEFR